MRRTLIGFTALAPMAGLLIGAVLHPAPAHADTFGGRAFAAYAELPLLAGGTVRLSDSGELPPNGGWTGAGLLGADVPNLLRATVLNAATSGGSGAAASSSSLADVTVLPGYLARLTAEFVRAQTAIAGTTVLATSEIRGLTFAGRSVTVTGLPNQRVDLPGVATLFINEQTRQAGGGTQTVAVNALRLVLATGGQIVLGGARSQVNPTGDASLAGMDAADACGAVTPAILRGGGKRPSVVPVHETPECHDFMTGGGWFEPRHEGGPAKRVNFGFNAGYRTPGGPLLGHFNLVDHNDQTHIKGVNVLSYFPLDSAEEPCRIFGGDAEVNGTRGYRYFVEACDYGEPGRDDRLRVIVFGPGDEEAYFADNRDSSKVCSPDEPRCGDLDGGNIQIHKPCRQQPAAAGASPERSGTGSISRI